MRQHSTQNNNNRKNLNEKEKKFWKESKLYISGFRHPLTDE